jgi:hypothetical protein
VGCVPEKQSIRPERNWGQLVNGTNASIVVGRIEWREKGESRKIEKGLMAFWISPQLLRLEDRVRMSGEVDEDGRFIWQLEPGTYVVNRINYRDPWSGNYYFVPKVGFRVDKPEAAYYIGTLRADFDIERDLIGGVSGVARFVVVDEFDETAGRYSMEFGSLEVSKSLMVRDERLPVTIDTTPEFNMAIQILNAVLQGM